MADSNSGSTTSSTVSTRVSFRLTRRATLTLLLLSALCWMAALALWLQVDADTLTVVAHEAIRRSGGASSYFLFVSQYGLSSIILLMLVYLLGFRSQADGQADSAIVFVIILSFVLGGIAGDLLKEIVDRARPFVEHASAITALSQPKSPAFPSGHATKSLALALPFLVLIRSRNAFVWVFKIATLGLSLAVGYSRIVLGAHYPSDVLAGFGMAMLCLPLAVVIANRIGQRVAGRRHEIMQKVGIGLLVVLMLLLPLL